MKLFCVHRRGSTILASTSLPLFGLEQEFYGLVDEIFWLSFSNV